MTISDTLIIVATVAGPILAVQAQKWIERARERRNAQRQLFYDLMATRATRVAPKHVEALNRIDLEFSGKGSAKGRREVLNRWRIYADHLNINLDNVNEAGLTQWNVQGDEFFTDLLEALADALGYPFDRVQLKRGIYYPRAHGQADMRREIFEREIVRLLTGDTSLNMRVTDFPASEEDAARNRNLQEALLSALSGEGALRTKTVG